MKVTKCISMSLSFGKTFLKPLIVRCILHTANRVSVDVTNTIVDMPTLYTIWLSKNEVPTIPEWITITKIFVAIIPRLTLRELYFLSFIYCSNLLIIVSIFS